MAAAVHVQIVTNSEERRREWGEALAAAGISVARPMGGLWEGLVDVVLTDQPLPGDPGDAAKAGSLWLNGSVQVSSDGTIDSAVATDESSLRFDPDGPPRVHLPADASAREIVLACQLVAAVVRLRRGQRDANERASRWKQLADADPLTGLMNRRAFSERLMEFLRISRGKEHCCLALLDLDRFKPVNDEIGHSAGDALLRQVAVRLSSAVRKGDLVCRLGGDEFAVALFGVSPEVACRLVDRLREAATTAAVADQRTVAASAGWAMFTSAPHGSRPSAGSPELLSETEADVLYQQAFEQADTNLRAAKSAGRNRTIPC